MTLSSIMSGHRPHVEIDVGRLLSTATFSANGKHLVSGDKLALGDGRIRVWGAEDGKQLATMEAGSVQCLALSPDGKWIVVGTTDGKVIVGDAKTYKRALLWKDEEKYPSRIRGVDFSPDSTRFVVALQNNTAIVWDVANRKQVLAIHHIKNYVRGVKYSPQGDRIATGTWNGIQIWDSNDGHLLVDIKAGVDPYYNTGLLWFGNHLFVVHASKIRRFDASTGSVVSEWTVPESSNTGGTSCLSLSHSAGFIAYSIANTVTLWDISTYAQLGSVQHPEDIGSIAFSPDNQLLAIIGARGKVTIEAVEDILPAMCSHVPFIHVSDMAFDSWKQDLLADTETLLTYALSDSGHQRHHALANRALIRARLRRSNLAIDDAEESIGIRPSVIGYMAKSIALFRAGKKAEGCRVYDYVFRHCLLMDVDVLLLIKAVVLFMAGETADAILRVGDLIATAHSNPIYNVVQAYMYLLLGNSNMESNDYENAIYSFKCAQAQMRDYVGPTFITISLARFSTVTIFGWKFDGLDTKIRQRLCEALHEAGRTREASEALLKMTHAIDEEVYMSALTPKWVSNFTQKCLSIPSWDDDTISKAARHDEAMTLREGPSSSTHQQLLGEWVKATLVGGSWRDALVAAAGFMVPRSRVYRALYEHLEAIDHMVDAKECFCQMMDGLVEQENEYDEQLEWILEKSESLGDSAMSRERHDEAITHYSAALALVPVARKGLLIKRSKAYLTKGLWEEALHDANKIVELDPSSPSGYERKHAALHKAGDYENAICAFEAMLSRMSESPDPGLREYQHQYVNPAETRVAIRTVVQDFIRESPRVLINTVSGRLLDKAEQAAAFESLPVFSKLVASMTTGIDHACIERDVEEYYRYAMFSHRWEKNEPLFEEVIRMAVYDLEESITHDKLKTFCKIVRDSGLHWAWSDTCCINKADHFVLQEALVAMFKWYEGSALTLVLLRGVPSPSRRGDLVRSIWNTRAWTFQEYHASKVVRFYNQDWTLYMNLDIPNHKESLEILSEMEEVTGVSAQALMAFRPGLCDIREKLCLASTRETTLVEDVAYSLLGIFSISLPIVYGEGDQALGRLLGQLLTSSGDTSILAWTGKSGTFNSCLPTNITVFNQLPINFIPSSVTGAEMATITAGLRASSLASATKLYDRLSELRVPSFSGKRMTLPCIAFKLGPLSVSRTESERVFKAQTAALGVVRIKAEEDLSRFSFLYLIHPWIDFLLDRQPVGSVVETIQSIPEENPNDPSYLIGEPPLFPSPSGVIPIAPRTRAAQLLSRFGLPFGRRTSTHFRDTASLRPPSSLSPTDKEAQALRAIARLRQPFGALLLTRDLGNVSAYRRVAAESLITVQVEEITPIILDKLVDSVRVLDVL